MEQQLDYVAIGRRIRAERKKQKLTVDHLAYLSDMTATHLNHIEKGSTKLSLNALVCIANALRVRTDTLLCDCLVTSQDVYAGELNTLLQAATVQQARLITQIAEVILHAEPDGTRQSF